MQRLNDRGFEVMDKMIAGAGEAESNEMHALLDAIPDRLGANRGLYMDIDSAIGALLVQREKAAFLAGLEVAKNPLALLVE